MVPSLAVRPGSAHGAVHATGPGVQAMPGVEQAAAPAPPRVHRVQPSPQAVQAAWARPNPPCSTSSLTSTILDRMTGSTTHTIRTMADRGRIWDSLTIATPDSINTRVTAVREGVRFNSKADKMVRARE